VPPNIAIEVGFSVLAERYDTPALEKTNSFQDQYLVLVKELEDLWVEAVP